MRSRCLLLAACGCAVLTGCGNARTPAPDLSVPAVPGAFARQAFASAGVSLRTPTDWQIQPGSPPVVASIHSGLAAVAIWRYPRVGALPHTQADLHVALRRLLARVRERDKTFRLATAAVVPVAHRDAIQLRGLETIDGSRREVRSTHLYVAGAEIVIDAYAPPSKFRTVDRAVFHPLLRGLRVQAPSSS